MSAEFTAEEVREKDWQRNCPDYPNCPNLRCPCEPALNPANSGRVGDKVVERAASAFMRVRGLGMPRPWETMLESSRESYRPAFRAALEAALAAQGQGDVEVARLQGVIERDRTVFCGLIAGLKRELQTREWLGNENARAAGGYRYDEPGFISEFGEAWTAIMGALDSAHHKFRDFTDCPRGDAARASQAEAQAILDAPPASPAGVPDGERSDVWIVQDEAGQPIHCASWPQACHEHINDAINEHGIDEARAWKVLHYSSSETIPPAPAKHCDRGPDDCVQCSVLAGTFAVKSAAPSAPEDAE